MDQSLILKLTLGVILTALIILGLNITGRFNWPLGMGVAIASALLVHAALKAS